MSTDNALLICTDTRTGVRYEVKVRPQKYTSSGYESRIVMYIVSVEQHYSGKKLKYA